MTKRNHLLEADIEHYIKKARNGKLPEKKEEKKSFFNLSIVFLITVVVLISLWLSLKR